MKSSFYLWKKYIRGHLSQFIGSILCLTLFLAAFMLALLYRDCSFAAYEKQNKDRYGAYTGIIYHPDLVKVKQNQGAIQESGSGVVAATAQVKTNEGDIPIYMGYMDDNAISLKAIYVQEGRLPEAPGEIAIENTTCTALGISPEIGNTVVLPLITQNGVEEKNFQLTGIIQDYVSQWKGLDGSKITMETPPPAILTYPQQEALYCFILCNGVRFQDDFGGTFSENMYFGDNNRNLIPKNLEYSSTFFLALAISFAFITLFGVHSIIAYTNKTFKKYILLLRSIGMSRNVGIGIVFLQICILFVTASILCTLISLLLCATIVEASKALGTPLVMRTSGITIAVTYILAAVSLLTAFLPSIFSLLMNKIFVLRNRSARHSMDENHSLNSVWRNATKRTYRTQNWLSILLAALCIVVSITGSFTSIFLPRISYLGLYMNNGYLGEDYTLYVNYGSSMPENFYITLPRNMGFTEEDLEMIYKNKLCDYNLYDKPFYFNASR